MKTIEEFIREIGKSEALQGEIVAAVDDVNVLAEFLKKNDVDGTVEDFCRAINAMGDNEGEITDGAAEAVAGGGLSLEEIKKMARQIRSGWYFQSQIARRRVPEATKPAPTPEVTGPGPVPAAVESTVIADSFGPEVVDVCQ